MIDFLAILVFFHLEYLHNNWICWYVNYLIIVWLIISLEIVIWIVGTLINSFYVLYFMLNTPIFMFAEIFLNHLFSNLVLLTEVYRPEAVNI